MTGRRLPRRPPALLVELRLEERPTLRLVAASLEDERRLVEWLRRTRALEALGDDVARLVAGVDEREVA